MYPRLLNDEFLERLRERQRLPGSSACVSGLSLVTPHKLFSYCHLDAILGATVMNECSLARAIRERRYALRCSTLRLIPRGDKSFASLPSVLPPRVEKCFNLMLNTVSPVSPCYSPCTHRRSQRRAERMSRTTLAKSSSSSIIARKEDRGPLFRACAPWNSHSAKKI